jgi:hypothetical protein
MLEGWKLTPAEIESFAAMRMEVQELLDVSPERLTAPATHVASLVELAERAIDSEQSRDFYHGLASGLKLFCNYARETNAPRPVTQGITHALARCCALYLDAAR